MSVNEEVEEHLHHAHEPFDKMVAASMAIMAAMLALVSVLGQHFVTEELLMQAKASDQWAYYQAKDIRRFTAEATRDTLGDLKQGVPEQSKYDQLASKYKSDATKIQDQAKEYERESERSAAKGARFHYGEIFLELAVVLSSLAILSKQKMFYLCGVVLGLAGLAISVTGWLI